MNVVCPACNKQHRVVNKWQANVQMQLWAGHCGSRRATHSLPLTNWLNESLVAPAANP